jgi:hypothetical protein
MKIMAFYNSKTLFFVLRMFQSILFLKFSLDDDLFIIIISHYYKIFFESTFSCYMCEKLNAIISKVHYESIIFLEFSQIFNMIFIRFYYNMDNLHFNNVIVEYGFTF